MNFNRRSSRARFVPWVLLSLPIVWALSMACVLQKKLLKREQQASESEKTLRKALFTQLFHWCVSFRTSLFRFVLPAFTLFRLLSFPFHRKTREEPSVEPAPLAESNDVSPLNELIDHNIEAIISLHMHAELKVSHHQRFLERATSHLGRPRSFYLVLLFVVCWVSINVFASRFGLPTFDPAPFAWLQGLIGLGALLMTILVLTTQNRQAKLAERRKHLDLQVNLIVEHKVSKLIALVEELRRDIPIVKDRDDQEAEAMMEAVDPQVVFQTLDVTLEEVNKEIEQTVIQSDVELDIGAILPSHDQDSTSFSLS
jgi:uncharacterized membrane protein